MTANFTNLQRYSIHDGEGIRTTVFFMGCPLRCAWCHNPENIGFSPTLMYYADRCVGCGVCAARYPESVRMEQGRPTFSGGSPIDPGVCSREALELAGRSAAVGDIVKACLRDLPFYEQSGGGVTLSGGEVMAQDPEFLRALTAALKKEGLNIAIDTCGHAPWAGFEAVLPYADTFLYDIKQMDSAAHRRFTGVENSVALENLTRLSRAGAAIHLRLPLIEGVNCADDDINAIIAFLRAHGIRPQKISLLPYHSTGTGKQARLVLRGPDTALCETPEGGFAAPSPEKMEAIAARFREAGFAPVSIGG